MKNKTSIKMSDENKDFWKNLNRNCIKTDSLYEEASYSKLQSFIVKYFKLNNERYLELIKLIGDNNKDGAK